MLAMSGVFAQVMVPPGWTFAGGAVVVAPVTWLMPPRTWVRFLVNAADDAVDDPFLVVAVVGLLVVAFEAAAVVAVEAAAVVVVSPTTVDVVASGATVV